MDRTTVVALGVTLLIAVVVGIDVYQVTVEAANQCAPGCNWLG